MDRECDDAVPEEVRLLEKVTVDARRRALEAMAFGPNPGHRDLQRLVPGPLGLAVVEPTGERFAGEGAVLADIAAAESAEHDRKTRTLVMAALDVWRAGCAGTAASRTALLRAILAFLLHHSASQATLHADETPSASR